METWFMQTQSFCIVALMLIGLFFRRQRKKHITIMSIAMIWDLLLILQIEFSRSAILKASKAATNELLLNIHVSIAVSTVILYIFMVYTGRALLAGRTEVRKKHRILGYSTFLMRILTFVTSFWAVVPKE
jgi:hypothetical protein